MIRKHISRLLKKIRDSENIQSPKGLYFSFRDFWKECGKTNKTTTIWASLQWNFRFLSKSNKPIACVKTMFGWWGGKIYINKYIYWPLESRLSQSQNKLTGNGTWMNAFTSHFPRNFLRNSNYSLHEVKFWEIPKKRWEREDKLRWSATFCRCYSTRCSITGGLICRLFLENRRKWRNLIPLHDLIPSCWWFWEAFFSLFFSFFLSSMREKTNNYFRLYNPPSPWCLTS